MTSSFAPVLTTTATRGRCLTINKNRVLREWVLRPGNKKVFFAHRPPSFQSRWVFLRMGCVSAHAVWPLQPSGLAVLQGLEQRNTPRYSAAQRARLDPGAAPCCPSLSDSLQLLHIWHLQMWVWKRCTLSASICCQHILTPQRAHCVHSRPLTQVSELGGGGQLVCFPF